MLSAPEALPIAAAGLQGDKGVKRTGLEPQYHHQDNPDDRGEQRFLSEHDQAGEQGETYIQIYKGHNPPGHRQQLGPFGKKISSRESVDQNNGHRQ